MGRKLNWTAAVLAALASVAAAAEPNVPYLLSGEKVTGSLAGASERKLVAFAGVEGSKLSVKCAAVKGSRLVPKLELIDPDGVLVDLGATNAKSGSVASFKGVALGETGVWRIGLASDGATGGAFELSASASAPSKFRWNGTITAAGAPSDRTISATPGASISIAVAAKGGSPAIPVVELVAPSGAVVASTSGAKGRARLDFAPLGELGAYTVRVRGEPGSFAASARLRAPTKRKPLFGDVASVPEIRGVSPGPAPDGLPVTFVLTGVGFGQRQTATLGDGARTLASAPIVASKNTDATAVLDLGGVAPGSYVLGVSNSEGRSSVAPSPLVVTNRAPSVGVLEPPEAWGRNPFEADVLGAGFDSGATVKIRVAATGDEVPVEIVGATESDRIRVRVNPAVRTTGPCDVEVTDPDGGAGTLVGGIDLLGFRIDPVTVRQRQTSNLSELSIQSAALDEVNGRVLIAVRDTRQKASFTLCDAATLAVVDSFEMDVSKVDVIDVAWDPVGRTFALCINNWSNQAYARVMIVRDDDIRAGISDTTVAGPMAEAAGAAVAAARDTGGYMVVWQQRAAAGGYEIRATTFSAAGVVDPSPSRVVSSSVFLLHPDVAWRSPGRFVVAYSGSAPAPIHGGIWAEIVDGDGYVVTVPALVASSTAWSIAGFPQIAQAPENGPTLINFSYDASFQDGVYDNHAACVRLAPGSVSAGPPITLDAGIVASGGWSFNATWDPARDEFVAACVLEEGGVLIRRIAANGTPRPATVVERFAVYWPVLYAGSAPGSLGLAVQDVVDVNPAANPPIYRFDLDVAPYR